jgi:hypothetical protein
MAAKRRFILAALPAAAFTLALAPGAAEAQFFARYWGGYYELPAPPVPSATIPVYGALPAREVGRILAEDGLRLIAPPRRKGRTYLAEAVDPRGRHHRITLDAYDGTILNEGPVAPQARAGEQKGPGQTAAPAKTFRGDETAGRTVSNRAGRICGSGTRSC